jgi:nucleotide-binding universal stress UspA family protein
MVSIKKDETMKKKLLIATDGSMHAKQALNYAAGYMRGGVDCQCTLINVHPIMSQYLIDEAKTDAAVRSSLKKLHERNHAESEQMLNKSREDLLRRGIAEADVDIVSQERTLGLAKDILEYGLKHSYDAIVAGRRGLSRVQKLFMGSATSKLVEYNDHQTLWIVDAEIEPKRLLIAVDVLAPWSELLERLAYLVGDISHLQLTFFHVRQEDWVDQLGAASPETYEMASILTRHEQEKMERFRTEAVDRMVAAGLDRNRVDVVEISKTAKIGKMIINKAESEGYDTVVIMRSGSGRAFFYGSTSRYVIDRLTGHALWIL